MSTAGKKASSRKLQEKIEELVAILRGIDPEKIILFGSAAAGRAYKDSDLDLCLIKEGDRLKVKREIWGLLRRANYDWAVEPDIHVYEPLVYTDWLERGDPFIAEIEKGRVLYERPV